MGAKYNDMSRRINSFNQKKPGKSSSLYHHRAGSNGPDSSYKNLFYKAKTKNDNDFNSQAGSKLTYYKRFIDETSFHSDAPSQIDSDISAVAIEQRPGRVYYDANNDSNSPFKRKKDRGPDDPTFEKLCLKNSEDIENEVHVKESQINIKNDPPVRN